MYFIEGSDAAIPLKLWVAALDPRLWVGFPWASCVSVLLGPEATWGIYSL